MSGKVLLTDHPWPATDIEAARCAAAGYELVVAPDAVTEAQLVELAADADAILTCWAKVTSAVIEAAPRLKVITRLGVGVDNIDLAAAGRAGATVTRVPDYCVDEVSSHVVAFVHAWARGIAFFDKEVHEGRWVPSAAPLRRVKDLTVGIWGYGLLGADTAAKFVALGCTVLADDRHPERVPAPITAVPIDELLERSDVVSLHLPLNDHTRGLVDAGALGQMADGALLVNCARGGVVDHDALMDALDQGRPGAAALDVLPDEPNIPDGLLDLPNVILTPHVAFISDASLIELRERAADDLLRVLRGEPADNPVATP